MIDLHKAIKRRKRFGVLMAVGVVGTLLLFVGALLRILPENLAITLPVGALVGVVLVTGGTGYILTEFVIESIQRHQEKGGLDHADQ